MAQENDFLNSLGLANIKNDFGAVPVINKPQQTKLLGASGAIMSRDIGIESLISSEARKYLEDFDEKDIMAEIIFPKDIPADVAALFLNMVGATVAAPSNDKRFASKEFNNGYMFVVNKNAAEKFLQKYSDPKKLSDDAAMAQFCAALSSTKEKIHLKPWDKGKSAEYLVLVDEAYKFNSEVFGCCLTVRDKLNLMCAFGSDNFRIAELSDTECKKEEIFRNFIAQNIVQIENASNIIEQEVLIKKFMLSMIVEDTLMRRKYNELFYTSLGRLKMSKPLSMTVLLDNGEHVDFFKLDKTKSYRFMNHINVSKTREFIDFSNCDIHGHFTCARIKTPIALPRSVNFGLDCSYCCDNFINENTRFPKGVSVIDFTGTIKNFRDLAKLNLPDTVTRIALTNSVLNSVLKNAEALAEFRMFEQKYRNIKIVGDRPDKTLQDLLEQTQAAAEPKPVQPKTQQNVKPAKPVVPEKTSDWLTRKEILSLIEQDSQFSDIEGMDRFVKRAINSNTSIKPENRLVDGNAIPCVHINCLPTIKQTILQIIEENAKRAKPKEKIVEKQEKTVKQQTKKQVQSVRIKKYIPKQIWKDICNSCGNSLQLLYTVLDEINKVNNSYDTQTATDAPIQYIDKNGNWQCITNTEYKGTKAATQWLEKRDNRRIVWTINSGIMVAIAFFEDHVNNAKAVLNYREALTNAKKGLLMDGKTAIDKTAVKSSDFLNVTDLLKQYKPTKTETKTEPAVQKKAEPKPEPKLEPKQPAKPVKKTKAEVAAPVVVEPTAATPVVRKRRPRIKTQVDVKTLAAEISAFVDGLDEEIKKLSIEMCKQKKDPAKQLSTLKQIEHYLQEKINLQRG